MEFFSIGEPEYETDHIMAQRNPVRLHSSWMIPAVVCPVCIRRAIDARLTYAPPPASLQREFENYPCLPLEEWRAQVLRWAEQLGADPESIEPGRRLGPPEGSAVGVPTLDFVHAAPGRLWVQQKVADALAQSGLTGLTFHKVHLKPERKRVREETLPPLYELGIASRLRRKAFTPEEQVVCTICGRREFRDPGWLAVDESSWEGSDFMRLADNENYVVVTERAAEFVMQFDNVALHPMKDPDWA